MNKLLIVLSLAVIMSSCSGSSDTKERSQTEKESAVSIDQRVFGVMPSGEEVSEFTLKNANGISMSVITYGGIIRTLMLPDRSGNFEDVVLGYDSLEGYLNENPYFGAIIGRYGNRIAKGKFSLDSKEYQLETNNIGNHLHGGLVGFDKVVWKAKPESADDAVSLKMTFRSSDGEEGYPGNLDVTVIYTLNNQDELIFEYQAKTDQKTIVNLTNHAYYNLTGSKDDILGHELKINASSYLPVDETLIPGEIAGVAGTPFDFREYKKIGKDIETENDQLKNGLGYDHCWVLNEGTEKMNFAASLADPVSGRKMDIYTTEPGIQFYSGNFLDGNITGKDDVKYQFRTGLCLETQHFPDSPNRPDFPSVTLEPGEMYSSKTITKFSTQVK